DPGIRVGGKDLPFVKSEYIEHIPLGTFLGDTDESRYRDRRLVHNLANQWLTIVTTLELLEIAHGDFDVTNVLVCGTPPNVTLRLIDFDSMYVPTLVGRQLWEQGHENF